MVEDGTLARLESSIAGTLCGLSNSARKYVRGIGNVKDAFLLGIKKYALSETIAKLGGDAAVLIAGVWPGFVQALEIYAVGIGAGAVVGGIVGGVLGEGVGAAPGAIVGAELGADAATGVLWFLGIKFLAEYVLGHLGEATDHFKRACTLAWDAPGDPPRVDPAAREFGRAIASLFSLVVEAAVAFVLAKGLKAGLEKLNESKTGKALAPRALVEYWRQKIGVTDAPIPRKGIATAIKFFEENRQRLRSEDRTEIQQIEFMKGMDFSDRVSETFGTPDALKPGDKLLAYRKYNLDHPLSDNPADFGYFYTKLGTGLNKLGVASEGATRVGELPRQFAIFEVVREVNALKSTAKGVRAYDKVLKTLSKGDKTWDVKEKVDGGGSQYFIADFTALRLDRIKRNPK